MSPSPIRKHQKASMRLAAQLYNFVTDRKLGEVYAVPFDVHVSRHDVYQPDLLFVANAHLKFLQEDGVHGPPDLVIEVLSRSTAGFDLLLKKDSYEKFAVKEYLIVDPAGKTIECFLNTERGFETTFAGKAGSACSSVLPGFCVDLASLFA